MSRRRLTLVPRRTAERQATPAPSSGPHIRVCRMAGRIVLLEVQGDGTPGEELVIPDARATPAYVAWRLAQFERDTRAGCMPGALDPGP